MSPPLWHIKRDIHEEEILEGNKQEGNNSVIYSLRRLTTNRFFKIFLQVIFKLSLTYQ